MGILNSISNIGSRSALKKLAKAYALDYNPTTFGGSFGVWQVFSATHRKSHHPVSVWALDKAAVKKAWFKHDPDMFLVFLNIVKGDADIMARYTQPTILKVMEACKESASHLCYVTEPVLCTLADCQHRSGYAPMATGEDERDPEGIVGKGLPKDLSDRLHPQQIRIGMACILEALSFLHA
ncbi:hypothetical protein KIPB_011526, partial [Kipferlia bialata]|eukprot:g11526.t1